MSVSADQVTRLNPVARVILQGLYDVENPWHMLLGMHYILKAIWTNVIDYWKSKLKQPYDEDNDPSFLKARPWLKPVAFHICTTVQFPKPNGIKINMMPFVMGNKFKKTKLPGYLKRYWKQIIRKCIVQSEVGKIGYLTIQESFVDEGLSQRRPGIHTESPGVVLVKGGKGEVCRHLLSWGYGVANSDLKLELLLGGIYMASNVEGSCKVWDCQISRPKDDCPDVVGNHGDIEHLREFLPPSSEMMVANTVYWITDRTPHESLPLAKGTHRQFFRLVTSQVSVWYEEHSTKNPLGVVPDPKITRILKGSKFDGSCYEADHVPE